MHEIKIPKKVRVAGFPYSIRMGIEVDKELNSSDNWGKCSNLLRVIKLATVGVDVTAIQLSESFIHEVLHAINCVYGGDRLEERDIKALTAGLHQVFEQLGIRFIK